MRQPPARGNVAGAIRGHRFDQSRPVGPEPASPDIRIGAGEQTGRVVGGAAEHDAVDMTQMRLGLVQRLDAAIDADEASGSAAFSR